MSWAKALTQKNVPFFHGNVYNNGEAMASAQIGVSLNLFFSNHNSTNAEYPQASKSLHSNEAIALLVVFPGEDQKCYCSAADAPYPYL